MEMNHSIRLADGTVIDNLGLNGSNYVSLVDIDPAIFDNHCSPVVIDGEEHPHMELIQIVQMEDEFWIALRDVPQEEVDQKNMKAEVAASNRMAAIMFVLEAESEEPRFDETTMLENADAFVQWTEFWTGKRSQIVQFQGQLYRAIHDVLTPAQNLNPLMDTTNQIWKKIGNPGEEWPEWSQPITGVDNPYMRGDKVRHEGKHWVSDMDDNWWAPGAYGWTEHA